MASVLVIIPSQNLMVVVKGHLPTRFTMETMDTIITLH